MSGAVIRAGCFGTWGMRCGETLITRTRARPRLGLDLHFGLEQASITTQPAVLVRPSLSDIAAA